MGYEDDPYRDEDGEPLMDFDDIQSDREPSPEPQRLDDFEEDVDDWRGRERSQTPVYDNDPSRSKPRKRLIKKSDTGKQSVAPELDDEVEEDNVPGRFDDGDGRKRKKGKDGGSGKKEKRLKGEKRFGSSGGKGGSKFGASKKGFGGKAGKDHDGEVKEMWDTIAGGDSEVLLPL